MPLPQIDSGSEMAENEVRVGGGVDQYLLSMLDTLDPEQSPEDMA